MVGNRPRLVAVVVAVQREARAALETLTVNECSEEGGQIFYMCGYRDLKVVLAVVGMGIDNAKRGVSTVIRNFNPSIIISTGFAGAVDSSLKRGEVVLGKEIWFEGDPDRHFSSDQSLLDLSERCLKEADVPYRTGKTVTVDNPICDTEQKAAFGVQFKCLAVDMDSAAVGEVSKDRGLPFLYLRVVLDSYYDNLKVSPAGISKNGRLSVLRLIRSILKNPKTIPAILKLTKILAISMKSIRDVTPLVLNGISAQRENKFRNM